MEKRGFSNSLFVAECRYIQSIHETTELRNPDDLVGYFLPTLQRWRCAWLGKNKITIMRSDPFYYYLVARTRYYDELVLDAISDDMRYIINVGCGTDTRAYRFEHVMTQKGVKVLECDQAEAIAIKERRAKQVGTNGHVTYLSVDLNDEAWPDFEQWLGQHNTSKGLVLMEGVSPYVNVETFGRFLRLLASQLPSGSRVAYDFKLPGIKDEFGLIDRTQKPFRLSGDRKDVADYHEEIGYRLDYMEQGAELTTRLLTSLAKSRAPLFMEDALIQLEVMH